jgi:hypothetical protein
MIYESGIESGLMGVNIILKKMKALKSASVNFLFSIIMKIS